MTKISVKKPFTVLVGIVLVIVLGVVAFTKMTTDLLPNMELPYMIVYTTYPGASPERVESTVSQPLEAALGTTTDLKEIQSVSNENLSLVVMEFSQTTDMNAISIEVSNTLDQAKSGLPDNCAAPIMMQISPDMMPVMVATVDMDGMEIEELSEYLNDELLTEFERLNGVASVGTTGTISDQVRVTLNQDKIDEVNAKILRAVNSDLADAKEKIDEGQEEIDNATAKLDKAEKQLNSGTSTAATKMGEASAQVDAANAQLSAMLSQETTLKANQAAFTQERKAWEPYAEMQESVESLAKLIAMTYTAQSGNGQQSASDPNVGTQIPDGIEIPDIQIPDGISVPDSDSSDSNDSVEESAIVTQDVEDETAIGTTDGEDAGAETQTPSVPVEEDTTTIPSGDSTTTITTPSTSTASTDISADEAYSIIQQMTDEEFEATKSAVIAMLGGSTDTTQLAAMSRSDFLTLLTTTDKATTRVTEIDAALNNIETELATLTAMKPKLEESLKKAQDAYAKLEAAQLTTAIQMASGSSQIQVTRATLENAQKEIDAATEEFEDARKEAYENADISGLVTADMVSNILVAENFEMPAGYISSGKEEYILKVGQQYGSLKELKRTLLFHMDLDGVDDIRLKDVASVRYASKEDNEDSYALVNGNEAILLTFSKSSTASTSEVSKLINEKIADLQETNPELHITPLMDQGDYIELIVGSVLQNLVFGGILAVLVLLLFLRDVRPTIVIAFSIPMSVLFAIVLMYFSSITLNIISLSGLALGVGMLVDNSIVVIENIYRLRNQGVPAAKAAVRGASEVAGAIVASTLTTICVFLPIVFTEGLTRQLFTDMGLTIAYSLIASLIVALTVVPAMSSSLLKSTSEKSHTLFDRVVGKYRKALSWCLRHRLVTLGAVFALFLFAAFMTTKMGMEFMPDMSSSGQMSATMTMPDDATDEETEAMVSKVSDIFQDVEGVRTVGAISGSSLSMMSSNDTSVTFYILTEEEADGNELKKQMEEKTAGLPCELQISASTMDMSSAMATGVQIDIYGNDLDKLQEISSELAEKLESVEGLTDISDGNENPDMEKLLTIDKDAAMRKGLTVAQVFSSLSDDLKEEVESTTLTVGEADLPVVVVNPSTVSTANLMRQTVEATDAQSGEKEDVRLDDIADLSESTSLSSINRSNNQRTISVTALVDDDHNITLVSREIQKMMEDYEAPDGYTIEMTGENESIMEAMMDLILMLVLAIIFIYLIMVAQFQSLLSPFIVLFTLPLAFTGGLLALLITGSTLSVIAMLGFVMLAGVVVNNGIVFVDCVNRLRMDGMEKRAALVEAGSMRIRPILMTAMTTILAMSTMALGIGSGAEMGQGMAIVIIGGLTYATVLTLIVVPIMYDLLFRRAVRKIDIGEEDPKDETAV
ncbi:MAG: efflux RND transporter permease subunit [Eubacteriales bacterium]|nr:efflux RND transporter permease subunit [Eubacteriales bacterium]